MSKPYPAGTVTVATPGIPGTKEQPEGAGYSPVYIPYGGGGGWTAPGYENLRSNPPPFLYPPRIMIGPDGSTLIEVSEQPPPMAMQPGRAEETPKVSGGAMLLIAAIAAALLLS